LLSEPTAPHWLDSEKSKAGAWVTNNIVAIFKEADSEKPNSSLDKIEPMQKHFAGCKKAKGYRYGPLHVMHEGKLVPKSVVMANKIANDTPEVTKMPVAIPGVHPAPPPAPKNQAVADALTKALAENDLETEAKFCKSFAEFSNAAKHRILAVIASETVNENTFKGYLNGLSYSQLNDIKVEIDVIQQELFDKLATEASESNALLIAMIAHAQKHQKQ
jgi:hypothetical protein